MKGCVLFVVLCWALSTKAQDSIVALQRPYHGVIKFALSSLLDQDATLQGGLEYQTGPRTSLQAEFSYGWKGLSVFDADLEDYVKAEVWRARSEVRFYKNRYRTNHRREIHIKSRFPLGNYWAIDGLAKQINVTKRDYEFQPVFSSAAPRYIGLSNVSRYVLGTHLKVGRQFAFYDPPRGTFSRILFDIYLGAGIRWSINDLRHNDVTRTPDCGCGIGRFDESTEGQWAPSLTAGLKVGFAL